MQNTRTVAVFLTCSSLSIVLFCYNEQTDSTFPVRYIQATGKIPIKNKILSTLARLNARLAAKMQAKLTKARYTKSIALSNSDVPMPLSKASLTPEDTDVSKYEAVDYASTMESIQRALKKLEATRDKTLAGLESERSADLKRLNSEIARQTKLFRSKVRLTAPLSQLSHSAPCKSHSS